MILQSPCGISYSCAEPSISRICRSGWIAVCHHWHRRNPELFQCSDDFYSVPTAVGTGLLVLQLSLHDHCGVAARSCFCSTGLSHSFCHVSPGSRAERGGAAAESGGIKVHLMFQKCLNDRIRIDKSHMQPPPSRFRSLEMPRILPPHRGCG